MITPGQRMPIVIATKPIDFRRGHDGLAATVQAELGLDPHSGLTVLHGLRALPELSIGALRAAWTAAWDAPPPKGRGSLPSRR